MLTLSGSIVRLITIPDVHFGELSSWLGMIHLAAIIQRRGCDVLVSHQARSHEASL